jgi:hypothetical protein
MFCRKVCWERHIKEADKAYYVGQIPVYTTSEIKGVYQLADDNDFQVPILKFR